MFNHLVKLTLVILLLTNQATSQRVIIKVDMIIPQPILVCWLVHAGVFDHAENWGLDNHFLLPVAETSTSQAKVLFLLPN